MPHHRTRAGEGKFTSSRSANYRIGRHRTGRHRTGRHRSLVTGFEALESRQLLAIDWAAGVCTFDMPPHSIFKAGEAAHQVEGVVQPSLPKATHAYFVEGSLVDMHVHPLQVALAIPVGMESGDVLSLNGLRFVRRINEHFSVYESPVSAMDAATSLKKDGLVAEFVPVFVLQESNSEAVLLDEIIVSLQPGENPANVFKDVQEIVHYRRLAGTPDQYIATVNGTGQAALEVLNSLQSKLPSGVEWVEPNFYQNWQKFFIPNDPRFGNQWHMHNTGQFGATAGVDVRLTQAWNINPGGSSQFVVGIIDDGVEAHPDLRRWVNPGEVSGDGIDNDGNGWVDDVFGWNFVGNNNASGSTTAVDVHGTPVAGISAAIGNNNIGVAGASFNSMVSSARIFEGPSVASDANIAAALYYMAGRTANGLGTWKSADVVNNSWGGGGASTAINNALTWGTTQGRKGVGTPFFFASGNGFANAVSYPASRSAVTPGVIAVGALNSSGLRSDYSNFGTALDFVTPSDNAAGIFLAIDSTDIVGAGGYNNGTGSEPDPDYTGIGTTGFGGTSAASPLATGIAALVMDQADKLGVPMTAASLQAYLRNTTDLVGGVQYDVATGKNIQYGFGLLNAFTAVAGIGKPEISVVTATEELVSGTSVLDVGTSYVGQHRDLAFRIRNQGTSTLDLSGLAVTSPDFSILTGFGDNALSLGEATTFVIRFLPSSAGPKSTTITILSNDQDEGTFTFDVLGQALVRTVSGYAFEDWNANGVLNAGEGGLAGRIMYIDENNNGLFDDDLITRVYSMTTPIPLPDVRTTLSTIDVSGFDALVTDVNVTLNITHTWNADLDIALISPTGKRVVLFEDIGGNSRNFINTILDDEAALSIRAGTAPFTGRFRPFGLLSDFDGDNPNGVWTLEVTDDAAGDVGTLNSWSLEITGGEKSTRSDDFGYYFFDDLAPGTYNIRSVPFAGWQATDANLNTVTVVSPDDFFVDQNFGSGRANRFYAIVFDDTNGDGVQDANEAPLGGRELFADANGNGQFDSRNDTFTISPDAPITDFSTTRSTLNVSGLSNPIADVDVLLNITHTYNGDLVAALIHPDGTRVPLFSNVGGSSRNFIDTILDDQAVTLISAGNGPFTGRFRPQGSLASFNNKLANGAWTLEIRDTQAGDIGRLNSWGLVLTTAEASVVTNVFGLAHIDLLPGSYGVQLVGRDGWSPTVPATGIRSVTASGVPLFNQTYGSRQTPADQQPPTVLAPIASGSSWQAAFIDAVDGSGTGAGNGIGLQLTRDMQTIVYSNVDRLHLAFSEPIANPEAANFELRDSNGVLPFNLSYDATTFVATLALSSPLGPGKYRLAASDRLTDLAGNQLDGDESGAAGGVFDIRFDLLPADSNGDRRVTGSDLAAFSGAFLAQAGQPTYNPRADWNADGRVLGSDLAVFSMFFTFNINTLAEPGAPFGGFGPSNRVGGVPHDDFFKRLGEKKEEEERFLLSR
jgi:large repetitive protein